MGLFGKYNLNPVAWGAGQLLGSKAGQTVSRINDPLNLISGRSAPGGAVFAGGSSSFNEAGFDGQKYDSSGRPILANRTSNNNANGTIQSQFQTKDATNMGAMDQARQEALRAPGQMSRYSQMALTQGQNQNAQMAAGKQSQALNGLAMQGGLRSGARERLATSGMQGQLQANQNTYSQIQNQDEQSRVGQLQNQVGNEATYGQNANAIQNQNIGRGLAENSAQNEFNMNRYGKAMEAWGADKSSQAASAQAQQAKATSGLFGGGGFLGLGF